MFYCACILMYRACILMYRACILSYQLLCLSGLLFSIVFCIYQVFCLSWKLLLWCNFRKYWAYGINLIKKYNIFQKFYSLCQKSYFLNQWKTAYLTEIINLMIMRYKNSVFCSLSSEVQGMNLLPASFASVLKKILITWWRKTNHLLYVEQFLWSTMSCHVLSLFNMQWYCVRKNNCNHRRS